MLIHEYLWYYAKILQAGLTTLPGIAALLALAAAIYVMFAVKSDNKSLIVTGLIIGFLVLQVVTLYTARYEFVETDEFVSIAKTHPDDEDCGVVVGKWFGGAVGLFNACPKGCYRGATIKKTMRFTDFPPWPRYQRTTQCWKRSEEFPLY